jgi:hypothetical protein
VSGGASTDDLEFLILEDRPQDRPDGLPGGQTLARQPFLLIVILHSQPGAGDWFEVWCNDCLRGACTWVCPSPGS